MIVPPSLPLATTAPLPRHNIRGSLLGDVAAYLALQGQSLDSVLAQLDFDPSVLTQPDLRIPVGKLMALLDHCAELTGQEDFGLRIAEWRGMPDLGPIVLLLRRETTLRGALRTLVKALHLHSNALYLTFEEGEDSAVLAMDVMTGEGGFSRQCAEMVVRAIVHMVGWMVGPGWQPAAVGFRHGPKLPDRVYRRYLGCRPDFRQEFNGVVLDNADLARRMDPVGGRIVAQASAMLTDLEDRSGLYLYRVQQLLVLTLPRGEARADTVAALLGTNRRTLNRRLAGAEVNFSQLLDRVRRELAMQYVTDSDQPFTEIAPLLGFDSLSAFSRWFRTAYGQAPRDWRAQRAG